MQGKVKPAKLQIEGLFCALGKILQCGSAQDGEVIPNRGGQGGGGGM